MILLFAAFGMAATGLTALFVIYHVHEFVTKTYSLASRTKESDRWLTGERVAHAETKAKLAAVEEELAKVRPYR